MHQARCQGHRQACPYFFPDRRSISEANFEPFLSIFTRRWRTPVSPALSLVISSEFAPRISSVWSRVSSSRWACASRFTPLDGGLRDLAADFGASGAAGAAATGLVADAFSASLLNRGDISPSTSCSMCAGMSSSSSLNTPLLDADID